MRALLPAGLALFFSSLALVAAEPPKTVTTPEGRVLEFDPDWTPRPKEGDLPSYVNETDVDWVDDRLRRMDTGRTFNGTFKYPHGDKTVTCFKGTAIRVGEKGEAAWLYDRNQLRWCCAWECEPLTEPTADNPTGFTPYLNHSDRRFGLLNTPTPKGNTSFSTPPGSDWSNAESEWKSGAPATTVRPRNEGRHLAVLRHGERTVISTAFYEGDSQMPAAVVVEHPWTEVIDGRRLYTRLFMASNPLEHRLHIAPHGMLQTSFHESVDSDGRILIYPLETSRGEVYVSIWTSIDKSKAVHVEVQSGAPALHFVGSQAPAFVCVADASGWTVETLAAATRDLARVNQAHDWLKILTPAPALPESPAMETVGARSNDDGAYVLDTLTIPYDNPYRALFFCSAVEFIPRALVSGWAKGDGPDIAVLTTVHGDVWLIDGVDEDLDRLRWKRFVSGLYQPLGIRVVEDRIMVLERGQLTILLDRDRDGVCDAQTCFCGDWHIGGGEHSYHTSLETDLDGNFYFHAGGDTNTPTGGTLIKVLADGSRSMVYCTGFRHPIGLGSLPDGRITGADQEGNWMPSTRIDIYKPGGFYGDMRAHHRDADPPHYDGPLCWLPRQMDGSAGGQVFVDRDDFGPLGGHLLHMSFGECTLMSLLMQNHAGVEQAGAVDLGLKFLAGIQRGRFRDSDGCLYLAGMDGWQTAAQADGCLQRVRYTGKEFAVPTSLSLENGGIKLQFSLPITRDLVADAASISANGDAGSITPVATDPRRYHVELWDYLWSKEYGSKRYSVSNPGQEGQDVLKVESATIVDPWTVFLKVPGLRPAMQAQIEYDVVAYHTQDDGEQRLKGTVYSTIHTTGPAIELNDGDRIALVGGTLVEREQRYGYWEHAITAAHPDKQLTFRNLGWSGDTVWTDSRGIFDPAEKGYARLVEQVQELRPTLFLLNYGGNEAWESLQRGEPVDAAIQRFITQYGKLIDDLAKASHGKPDDPAQPGPGAGGSPPRYVLLTPLRLEVGVGPNSDPATYNDHLAKYTAAIERLARDRGLPCINLADLYPWYESQPIEGADRQPLTENGLHLSEYGYWRTAPWILERLCAGTAAPSLELPTGEDAIVLISRLDRESQRIAVEALPEAKLKEETAILEFNGQFSSLPLPAFDEQPGNAPSQRWQMKSPGVYRMEIDERAAARGEADAWSAGLPYTEGPDAAQSGDLLAAIRRKNELYFHRWRPQNVTYLFLFRKHEQGNNAVEIPQFDPLIAAEESRIAELKVPAPHRYRLIREADQSR
jgi:lysophospholipase L1-like esterase